jgi:hypothetical protein
VTLVIDPETKHGKWASYIYPRFLELCHRQLNIHRSDPDVGPMYQAFIDDMPLDLLVRSKQFDYINWKLKCFVTTYMVKRYNVRRRPKTTNKGRLRTDSFMDWCQ